MKRKYLRALTGILMAAVLSLTSGVSVSVSAFATEVGGNEKKEYAAETEKKDLIDIAVLSENEETGEAISDNTGDAISENGANTIVSSNEQDKRDELISSNEISENEANTGVSKNETNDTDPEAEEEEFAGEIAYANATWNNYECYLEDKKLTLLKYTGTDTALTVPATASGVKLKGSGAVVDDCTVYLGNPGDYETTSGVWYRTGYELKSLVISNGVKLHEDVSYLFSGLHDLTSLDLSNLDTSNVKNMTGMFDNCHSLTTLNISNFNTSKVKNMDSMFGVCKKLTTLDLKHFDTSNVENMSAMFNGCENLSSLDISSFNTSNVTDMSVMFNDCKKLVDLDVSKFNTSKVKDMKWMFCNCEKVTKLDTSNFDTSKVFYFQEMFSGCSNLAEITGDCGNFNYSYQGVANLNTENMFANCKKLKKLNLKGFSFVKFPGDMITGCESLENVIFPNMTSLQLGESILLQGEFYFPETLAGISFASKLGNRDLTVYGPAAIKEKVEALNNAAGKGTGKATFVEYNSSSEGYPYDKSVIYAQAIILNRNSYELKYNYDQGEEGKGSKVVLTATLEPDNATNQKVWWSIAGYEDGDDSENAIVSISKYGLDDKQILVTAKGEGTATVIARAFGGAKRECIITIESTEDNISDTPDTPAMQPVTGVSLNQTASVEIGKTIKLNAKINPADASDTRVKWTCSDNSVAVVDEEGNVTGKKIGNTEITVTTKDGNYTASCLVTVTEPKPEPTPTPTPGKNTYTITFMDGDKEFTKLTVEEGQTVKEPSEKPSKADYEFIGWASGSTLWNFATPIYANVILTAKYIPKTSGGVSENSGSGMDAVPVIENKTVYLVKGQSYTVGGSGWSMKEGSDVAKVAAKTGKITAKKKGKAVASNGTDNYTVIVAEPLFDKDNKKATLLVGTVKALKLTIGSPDEQNDKKFLVTWQSSNPKVASVNDGTVTALGKGSTQIKAYVGGKAYVSKVTVTDTCKAPVKQKDKEISFSMNPMQSFNLKYDTSVFKVNGATWSGNGIQPTEKKGKPDGGFKNDIVSITKAGKFKAIGSGQTVLTGKDTQNREVKVIVTVSSVSTKEDTYVTKGKNETIKFPFVNNNKAEWESSDKNIISEFTKGKVKGAAVGNSTISCSYNGFSFKTLVYVEDPEFSTDDKLKLNNGKYELSLKTGDIYNRVKMKNVYQTVNLKSNKPAVAFIDENGIIYARGKGKSTVSTKINGKTYIIKVTVD